jgi:ADP-ribose pyrophosphatase
VGSRLLHQGRVISLSIDRFTGPDGETFEREVVRHPGAVSVVPVLWEDELPIVVLVRQYRAPLDALLLEIPAGKRDVPGEDPEVTAARELEEEVGYRATALEPLARFHNSAGFCDELSHVFLASGLERVPQRLQGIEEQHMTVEHVPLHAVPDLVASGRLTDAKSIIGLLLARERLGRR